LHIYNPDIIAQEKFGDWNSKEAVMQSVQYCETLREDCIKEKKNLIFETVLSVRDKVDYIRRAKEAGFFHPASPNLTLLKQCQLINHLSWPEFPLPENQAN